MVGLDGGGRGKRVGRMAVRARLLPVRGLGNVAFDKLVQQLLRREDMAAEAFWRDVGSVVAECVAGAFCMYSVSRGPHPQ